jgi:phospholipase DDHD1
MHCDHCVIINFIDVHFILPPDTVESITPKKVKGLRTMLNSSAMDILYYTSPLYRSEVRHINAWVM